MNVEEHHVYQHGVREPLPLKTEKLSGSYLTPEAPRYRWSLPFSSHAVRDDVVLRKIAPTIYPPDL